MNKYEFGIYNEDYAKRYIETTLSSGYTKYKNRKIAEEAAYTGARRLFDLGSNVSGIMRQQGSLRYQTEAFNIKYTGIDLSPSYFDRTLPSSLGVASNEIYPGVTGLAADITELPIRDDAIDFAVCADVIEHISHPGAALREIQRVLQPEGTAVVVVPSLYKLDAVQFPHIMGKRASSHENRLTARQWVDLSRAEGLSITPGRSKPLAIASGLSYLTWLDDRFVPARPSLDSKEEYSTEADLFRKGKAAISKLDTVMDSHYLQGNNAALSAIEADFRSGDIEGVLGRLQMDSRKFASSADMAIIVKLFSSLDFNSIDPARIEHLTDMISSSDMETATNMFLGNSAFMVLKKER